MSAIFGIIDFEGRPIDPEWIKSMQKDLTHRGPDGQGLYQEESMFMGHMLLQVTPESIYDKSPYEEDGFVITAYARLDEREAIMDRIGTPQEERETITDPILLLRSFRKFGKDFVKDIYGDFAFAIWDKKKKELFCARDQMGIKPFLYYYQDGRFVFSTEMRSIVRLPITDTSINLIYLRDYSIGLPEIPTETTWQNILRLKSAHTLTIKSANFEINEYWKPVVSLNLKYKTEQESAHALKILLERVISDHTRVINKIGIPLSGGLDSSSIACIAAKKFANEKNKIVSVSSVLNKEKSEPGQEDEREYIEELLRQEKNIDPTFVYHSDLYFTAGMNDKFEKHYDLVVHSYYLDEAIYQKLHSKSVRRMLSGTLGDMTVSNSTINPLSHLLVTGRLKSFIQIFSEVRKNQKVGFTELSKNTLVPLLPLSLLNIVHRLKGRSSPWDISDLPLNLNKREFKKLNKRSKEYYKKYYSTNLDILNSIWCNGFENFGEDWDCGPSHHQIEITYPLLDRRIIEFLLQIPVEHFYTNGLYRGLIREAMNGILPEKIRTRKNKLPYSPSYFQIHKKGIPEIITLLGNQNLQNVIEKLFVPKNLQLLLKSLVQNSKINNIVNYWVIIDLCITIKYVQWHLDKKNKTRKNEQDKQKTMAKANY